MEIKYDLGNYSQEEAYQKVDALLDKLVKKHADLISNPSKTWNTSKDKMDFEFVTKGINITGDIKIFEGKLVLNGNLPWLVKKLYSEKIEEIVTNQLDELFL